LSNDPSGKGEGLCGRQAATNTIRRITRAPKVIPRMAALDNVTAQSIKYISLFCVRPFSLLNKKECHRKHTAAFIDLRPCILKDESNSQTVITGNKKFLLENSAYLALKDEHHGMANSANYHKDQGFQ